MTKQEQAYEAVEEIVEAGWEFEAWDYGVGWWRLSTSDDPVKAMRRGDPRGMHEGALIVKQLYLREAT